MNDEHRNRPPVLELDGSQGEGGGQVLRTALSLSIVTGRAIHIKNIRARRSKPGLMAQHLKCVDAAAAISKATVDGAKLGSKSLWFSPNEIRSGRYRFDIGTAGATSLVFQTIFLPLSMTNSASSVIITGGTHVPWSPSFHYLERQWLPYLKQIGFDTLIKLDQAGFYPRGGGRITATIRPVGELHPLQLTFRGGLRSIVGISAVANLDQSIAERQKRQTILRLRDLNWETQQPDIRIKIVRFPSQNKGTLLLLSAYFENGSCCYYSLGELGKPAERVADEAVDAFMEFLSTDGAIDQYLADQLLIPLCFINEESKIRTSEITEHLITNASIIQSFLPNRINIQGEIGQPGFIQVSSL